MTDQLDCNKQNTILDKCSFLMHCIKFESFAKSRYIDNNITKDRCPIPMDTTIRLGPFEFSLQATIEHHGSSIDSGHYTASINCC